MTGKPRLRIPRICSKCGAKKSQSLDTRGHERWRIFDGEYYCYDCAYPIQNHTRYPNAKFHLNTPKVCAFCGSNETHMNMQGCPCWHNVNGKRYCANCFGREIRYPLLVDGKYVRGKYGRYKTRKI